jgi:hypothetical protein
VNQIALPELPPAPLEFDLNGGDPLSFNASVMASGGATTARSPTGSSNPQPPEGNPKRRMLGHTRSSTSPGPSREKDGTQRGVAVATSPQAKAATERGAPAEVERASGKATWQPANTDRTDGNPVSPRNGANIPRGGPQLRARPRYKIEMPQVLATLVNATETSVVVMKKGSWFTAMLSYNKEKVLMTSTARMPAFASAKPAVAEGDAANWIEVLMCVERSFEPENGPVGGKMPSASGKPIFRSNPQIFWNGEAVSLYGVLVTFIKNKLLGTQLAKFISSACDDIASKYPGADYKRLEKTVTNESDKSTVTIPDMDRLGKYIDAIAKAALKSVENIPPEVLQALTVLDHQIIGWAFESGFAIDEINAQRQNAIVQFFVTRGVSNLFTVPDGSLGAASVLRKYANKELNRLAPKLTAPILKASSNLLPAETKNKLAAMLKERRTHLLNKASKASASKKAEGQKAVAQKRGLTRAATERGSASSAPGSSARDLNEAKRKLLKAVRSDAAFLALSDAVKQTLAAQFEELKPKGLNAGKIVMATRKLVERIKSASPNELAELKQYLAILQKRLLLDALYGEAAFLAMPLAVQTSLQGHLNALEPAGMSPDVAAAAAKVVIDGTSRTKDELSAIELFLPVLETGRWRPDYAAKEVENMLADTWDLFADESPDDRVVDDSADGKGTVVPGLISGTQPQPSPLQSSQSPLSSVADGDSQPAQQGIQFESLDNPFDTDSSEEESPSVDTGNTAEKPVDPPREREKQGRRNS